MPDTFSHRFSPKEMADIRASLRDEQGFGKKLFARLAKVARHIPFAEDVLSAWFCARDPATPARVRYILMMAIGYFVLPIDAIPDFLPLIGFTDDAAVIAAAIATVAGSITPDHRAKARLWMQRD